MFKSLLVAAFMLQACGSSDESQLRELKGTSGSDDLYFVFGGGYRPSGSQVVLEKNIQLFNEVAGEYQVKDKSITRLFASGNVKEIKDVQLLTATPTTKEKLFSSLLDAMGCSNCDYRHNELEKLDGDLTRSTVEDYLNRAVAEADSDDKLNFYYTGHGSHEQNRFDRNFLALWRSNLNVQEYTEILDRLPKDTQSQTVMVQCFSGGFSQMNFVGGEPANQKLSDANRCGFFSQVPTRPAAGCSPDLNQREEYSPYFFAAYKGKTESGNTVDADYDKNGKVTSDEAHAYVIINENAIDVPVTTSSELLRQTLSLVQDDLNKYPWSDLKSNLKATETEIFKSISKGFGMAILDDANPFALISTEMYNLQANVFPQIQSQMANKQRLLSMKLNVARVWLDDRNPEFSSVSQIVKDRASLETVASEFERLPDYSEMLRLQDDLDALKEKQLKVQRSLAKWERLQYLYITKLAEAKLADVGKKEIQQRYSELQQCENSSFFK